MKKEDRTTRRSLERALAKANGRSIRIRRMAIIGWVCLAAVLAILTVLLGRFGHDGPVPMSSTDRLERLPAGFSSVAPANEDAVVDRTRKLAVDYRNWTVANTAGPAAAMSAFNKLTEPYLTDMQRLGAPLPVASPAVRNQALNAILNPKGWAAQIGLMLQRGVPVPTMWIGPVVADRQGNVQSTEGKPLHYHCYLVNPETVSMDGLAGSTLGTTIYLFASHMAGVAQSYHQGLDKIRATGQPRSFLDQCLVVELQGEPYRDSRSFDAHLATKIVSTLFAHELQHVRDRRLMEATEQPGMTDEAVHQLIALAEARGGLRQIADGELPLLSIGQIANDWPKQQGPYSSAERFIRSVYYDDWSKVRLDDSTTVRARAREALANAPYEAYIQHARAPDPYAAVHAEEPGKTKRR